MDKVGLRELLRVGVAICEEQWQKGDQVTDGLVDSITGTALDRLAHVGILAAEHDQEWLWLEAVEAIGQVYRLAIPQNWRSWTPPPRSARWLLAAVYRAYLMAGVGFIRARYRLLRPLFLFKVSDEYRDYWLRYAVTLVARAELTEAFPGKSLIGPMSHYIGERAQFASYFKSNQDVIVNTLCQVDFLACVAVVAESISIDRAYPNFGAYYSERTMPVVKALVNHGPQGDAIPDIPDDLLADILNELNKLAREVFFSVNGWREYDRDVNAFIAQHLKHGDGANT